MHAVYLRKFSFISFFIFLLFSTPVFAFSLNLPSFLNWFKGNSTPKHVIHRPSVNHKPPAHVQVGVYLLHVSRYNLQDASYQADFYLTFKCNSVCNNLKFEIMNAINSNVRLVENQNGRLVYRIEAELNKSNNLRNYPFDSHMLDIIIENRQLTNDKMIFEVDPTTTALDGDLNVVGFKLLPTWTATVTEHYYTIFQQSFSSYKFTMVIVRPWLAGVLKGTLPALIIIGCNFLALFMKIDHTSQRLGIATSTLIAAEVFHLNLTASLPPLGYVTYADMFMLINYLFLLLVLIEVVLTTYFIETKHHLLSEKINKQCAWLLPIGWFLLQVINWLVFNPYDLV